MASNEHSSLYNSQLHVPKDFSLASANTVLTKDGSNALSWADDNLRRTHFVRVGGTLSAVTSTDDFAPTFAGGSTHLFNTSVTDPTADAQDAVAQAQLYCTRAGFVNTFAGVVAATNGKNVSFKLFKGTPSDNSSTGIDLTQLGATLGSSATFAAGDVLIVTIAAGDTSSTTARFNGTIEVVYTE